MCAFLHAAGSQLQRDEASLSAGPEDILLADSDLLLWIMSLAQFGYKILLHRMS